MYLAFCILLVLITVFLHEYGHLYAMHKYGIRVKKLTLGLDVPYITLRFQHPKFCFGTPICLSPILIMGSVEMEDPKSIGALSLARQLEIYGSGIVMNLVASSFLIMLAQKDVLHIVRFCLFGFLILVFRKGICWFLLPAFSLAAFYYVPALLVNTFAAIPDAGQATSTTMMNLEVSSLSQALMGAGVVSIVLALLNLIPMQPLDGGKLISACGNKLLPSKIMKVYDLLTVIIMLGVILVGLYDLFLAFARLIIKAVM